MRGILLSVGWKLPHRYENLAEEGVELEIDPLGCLACYPGHQCFSLERAEDDHPEFHCMGVRETTLESSEMDWR